MGVLPAISTRHSVTDANFYCISGLYRYYEWITKGKAKLPHFIRRHDSKRPLWLGGLWDCVTLEGMSSQGTEAASYCDGQTGETQPLYTFALVTCPARRDMEWLHDRMPLIFEEGAFNMWSQMSQWASLF
jgi:putative SOS response-associated peptidase YedK